mgnify:CR=1 FL=1
MPSAVHGLADHACSRSIGPSAAWPSPPRVGVRPSPSGATSTAAAVGVDQLARAAAPGRRRAAARSRRAGDRRRPARQRRRAGAAAPVRSNRDAGGAAQLPRRRGAGARRPAPRRARPAEARGPPRPARQQRARAALARNGCPGQRRSAGMRCSPVERTRVATRPAGRSASSPVIPNGVSCPTERHERQYPRTTGGRHFPPTFNVRPWLGGMLRALRLDVSYTRAEERQLAVL